MAGDARLRSHTRGATHAPVGASSLEHRLLQAGGVARRPSTAPPDVKPHALQRGPRGRSRLANGTGSSARAQNSPNGSHGDTSPAPRVRALATLPWDADEACRGAGSPGRLLVGLPGVPRLWPCAHLPTPPVRGRDARRGHGCPAHTATCGPTDDAARPTPEPVTQVAAGGGGDRLLSLLWEQRTWHGPRPGMA